MFTTIKSKNRNWKPIIKKLQTILGKKYVIQRKEELLTYECDGLPAYRQKPAVVVLPSTTEEVSDIIKICDRNEIPWVARGAGTGLSGGALPVEDCLLVVTARMNRILDIDYDNQRIVVQPGVINNSVTQAVNNDGFFYAPDPSSQSVCSIGGNIAENSGGVHCLKYGVTTNNVLALKIVLPDGEIIDTGGIPEMPGYDLRGLFIGSEGTLGIATEITLKILKTPETICLLLADFTSIEKAGSTVTDIIKAGIIPAGMEIMDNLAINIVEQVLKLNCYPQDAEAILLIELDGLPIEVEKNKEKVAQICYDNDARNITTANDLETRMKLWKGRKATFGAAGKVSPDYFVQDGVIPRTQLASVLNKINFLGEKYGYSIINVFHAGDGNLHPIILWDHNKPGDLEKVEELGGEILKLCVKVGGSISGEHGIGSDKKCYMSDMFSNADLETMQYIRSIFNPKETANPTKIFPTPRSCGESANYLKIEEYKEIELF